MAGFSPNYDELKNKSKFAYLGFKFLKHPSTTTTKRTGNFLCEFKRGDQIILGVVFNRDRVLLLSVSGRPECGNVDEWD